MNLDNQSLYIAVGSIVQIALWLFYKILRNTKVFLIILLFTILIALLGYFNLDRESLKMVKGSVATWTFLPLFFMIYYWIFRNLFLIVFGNEPIMGGYLQSSWEQGEYRKLHIGDSIFTALTLILPFWTTLLF